MPHLTLNLPARQRKTLVSTLAFVVLKVEKKIPSHLFRVSEYKHCQSKLRLLPLSYKCKNILIRATQISLAPYLIITQSACKVSPKLVRNSTSFPSLLPDRWDLYSPFNSQRDKNLFTLFHLLSFAIPIHAAGRFLTGS